MRAGKIGRWLGRAAVVVMVGVSALVLTGASASADVIWGSAPDSPTAQTQSTLATENDVIWG